MNATDRRILCCKALGFYHEQKLNSPVEELTDDVRNELNDVSKTFTKTAKLIEKKGENIPCACPKVYTKKEWKALLRERKEAAKLQDGEESDDADEVDAE